MFIGIWGSQFPPVSSCVPLPNGGGAGGGGGATATCGGGAAAAGGGGCCGAQATNASNNPKTSKRLTVFPPIAREAGDAPLAATNLQWNGGSRKCWAALRDLSTLPARSVADTVHGPKRPRDERFIDHRSGLRL